MLRGFRGQLRQLPHRRVAIEFLLQHTAWGRGEVQGIADPLVYTDPDFVKREVARAAWGAWEENR